MKRYLIAFTVAFVNALSWLIGGTPWDISLFLP